MAIISSSLPLKFTRRPMGVFLFLLLALFLSTTFAEAHPGRTASDGCHYCRTNCAKWGEVEGARHCHGGSSAPPVIYIQPTATPVPPTPTPRPPTPSPTKKPTPTPTIIPNPSPTEPIQSTFTSTPTPTGEVLGETSKESSGSGLGLIAVGALGLAAWKLLKKKFRVKIEKIDNP